MTTNKSEVSLFSKINLRIAAIILSIILVQSVAVGSVLAANSQPITNQYGSMKSTTYPAVELQWKPVKPAAGEDVTFSIMFRDAASDTAKSHVDYTFTISREGKVVHTVSKHTHSGTDTINQKLDAGMHSITVTITDIDFNKVEPKSSDFSINVEKLPSQEQTTPAIPKATDTAAPIPSLEIKTDKEAYRIGETAVINAKYRTYAPGDAHYGKALTILIIGPDGKEYLRETLEPSSDGSIQVKFSIKREYPVGTWDVRVTTINTTRSNTFKVIEPEPSATPAKPGTETSKSGSIIIMDSAGQEVSRIKIGTGTSEKERINLFLKIKMERFSPSTDMTILVLDPDENVYLQKDITTDKDGSFSLPFALENTAKDGTWSIQVVTGDSIEEKTFEVVKEISGIESQTEVSAVVKNLKKMTMIAIKNTGTGDIGKISIKVKQGSIQFVKVISKQFKEWDRKRVASDEVVVGAQGLAVTDEGVPNPKSDKNKRTLQPGESMIIIMKWNDRPEFEGSVKLTPLAPGETQRQKCIIEVIIDNIHLCLLKG